MQLGTKIILITAGFYSVKMKTGVRVVRTKFLWSLTTRVYGYWGHTNKIILVFECLISRYILLSIHIKYVGNLALFLIFTDIVKKSVFLFVIIGICCLSTIYICKCMTYHVTKSVSKLVSRMQNIKVCPSFLENVITLVQTKSCFCSCKILLKFDKTKSR